MNPMLLLAIAQGVLGGVQAIGGGQRAKRLLQQRRAYQTPDEVTKALQLTENLAGQGYDAFTLNYLNNQIDRGFNKSVGVAERLGADPNTLSGLFDQKVNDIMKVGEENHAANMANISRYLTALNTVAENKAAEQKSQQDLIKDQQQAASAEQQSGLQNIIGGANTALSIISNDQIMKLFAPKTVKTVTTPRPAYSPVSATSGINLPTSNDAFLNALLNAKNNNTNNIDLSSLLSGIDWSQINKY